MQAPAARAPHAFSGARKPRTLSVSAAAAAPGGGGAASPSPRPGSPVPQQRVATTAEAAATLEAAAASSPVMSKVEMWSGDKKLQTQVFPLAQDTIAIRSLDWDRDRFDIEFG